MTIGLMQSIVLSLGGVGFSSPLLALRGRVVLGQGDGKACADDVDVSSATPGDAAVSGALLSDAGVSGALTGNAGLSGGTVDDEAVGGAVAGDTAPEC